MAKTIVKFLGTHTHVQPATELVSTDIVTGAKIKICDVPETSHTYACGELVTFRSKKDAKAFAKVHGGVCVIFGEAPEVKITVQSNEAMVVDPKRVLTVREFDTMLRETILGRKTPGGYSKVRFTVTAGGDTLEIRTDVDYNATEGRTLYDVLKGRVSTCRTYEPAREMLRVQGQDPEQVAIAYARVAHAVEVDACKPSHKRSA